MPSSALASLPSFSRGGSLPFRAAAIFSFHIFKSPAGHRFNVERPIRNEGATGKTTQTLILSAGSNFDEISLRKWSFFMTVFLLLSCIKHINLPIFEQSLIYETRRCPVADHISYRWPIPQSILTFSSSWSVTLLPYYYLIFSVIASFFFFRISPLLTTILRECETMIFHHRNEFILFYNFGLNLLLGSATCVYTWVRAKRLRFWKGTYAAFYVGSFWPWLGFSTQIGKPRLALHNFVLSFIRLVQSLHTVIYFVCRYLAVLVFIFATG